MSYIQFFKDHEIVSETKEKIVFSRKDDIAFRFSVSIDGIGTMTISGDIKPVNFGFNKSKNIREAIGWLGSIENCSSYVEEKALIGMGHDCKEAIQSPKWSAVECFFEEWISEQEEQEEKQKLIDKLKSVGEFPDDSWQYYLAWCDKFYVSTCFSESIDDIALCPSDRLELAHAALRAAYRIINEQ